MALHLGDVPLKRRKMHTPLNLASVASASYPSLAPAEFCTTSPWSLCTWAGPAVTDIHKVFNGLYIPFFKDLLSISKENKNLRQLVAEVW